MVDEVNNLVAVAPLVVIPFWTLVFSKSPCKSYLFAPLVLAG